MTQLVTPAKFSAALNPVSLDRVHPSEDGWLGRFQRRNADATIPHIIEQLRETGALENFRRSAAGEDGREGTNITDSDVYKLLEAIAWEIGRTGTTAFDAFVDEAVALITAAQHEDGYLNTQREVTGPWSDLAYGHELHTGGHLVQAGIALARVGRPELLEVARRFADLVVGKFGPQGEGFDGHPGMEDALVELYRETDEKSYLDTAKALVDRRGHRTMPTDRFPAAFFLDHEPVRESTEALGHVVRALYLDAACVDLSAETGDTQLRDAAIKRWESAHLTKKYITGGLGSRHFDESFGAPYELPASRAYAATSAGVADLLANWRLLLLTGEARYADAMEKLAVNQLPGSIGADGKSFFRANPLQVRTLQRNEDNSRIQRAPWVPSGPTNLARAVSQLGAYVATTQGSTLLIQQWVDATIDVPEEVGTGSLTIETNYPANGVVKLSYQGTPVPGARIKLRVPGWCEHTTLNGRSTLVIDSYIDQELVDGWSTTLEFAMEPRFLFAHPRVDAVRGCRALLRGPVLYCAEQVDVEDLESLVFLPTAEVLPADDGQLPRVKVAAHRRRQAQQLYSRSMVAPDPEIIWAELLPYYQWGNRRPAPMRVWLPVI